MKCDVFSIACCFQSGPLKGRGGGGWFLSLEIRVGQGSSGLRNPVSGEGQKFLPSVRRVWIFPGITHSDFALRGDKCQLQVPVSLYVSCRDLKQFHATNFPFICFQKHIYRMYSTYYV